MNESLGRLVAIVGLVLAVVALWLDLFDEGSQKYWDDGTVGPWVLILAALAGLFFVLSLLRESAAHARIGAAISLLLLGFYSFIPAALAFGDLDHLVSGGWLALVGALLAVLGGYAGSASQGVRPVRTSAMGLQGINLGAAVGAAGLVLSAIAIWTKVDEEASYWDFTTTGDHLFGIVMLVAVVGCGLGLLGALATRRSGFSFLAAHSGLLLAGLMLADPVADAFNEWDSLATGAWLGLAGGILAASGAALVHMSNAAPAPTTTPPPAATTPPAA
jgi:hypothetical protein